MLKHTFLIESGSIGADMVGNRPVCRLADKDASRLLEIVRLTMTLFECPWDEHTKTRLSIEQWHVNTPQIPTRSKSSSSVSRVGVIFPSFLRFSLHFRQKIRNSVVYSFSGKYIPIFRRRKEGFLSGKHFRRFFFLGKHFHSGHILQ